MFAAHLGHIFWGAEILILPFANARGLVHRTRISGNCGPPHSGTLTATGGIRLEKRLGGTYIVGLAGRRGQRAAAGPRAASACGNVSGVEEAAPRRRKLVAQPGVLDGCGVVSGEESSLCRGDLGRESLRGQGVFDLLLGKTPSRNFRHSKRHHLRPIGPWERAHQLCGAADRGRGFGRVVYLGHPAVGRAAQVHGDRR